MSKRDFSIAKGRDTEPEITEPRVAPYLPTGTFEKKRDEGKGLLAKIKKYLEKFATVLDEASGLNGDKEKDEERKGKYKKVKKEPFIVPLEEMDDDDDL
jgi:hypothetical protein